MNIEYVDRNQYATFHTQLFKKLGMEPYNFENNKEQFSFVSNIIKHTYLTAPKNNKIFIRMKSGTLYEDENYSSRSKTFDYEHRFEMEG